MIDPSKKYLGTILPYIDEVDPSKVYVYIPEIMALQNNQKILSVSNFFTNKLIKSKTDSGLQYYGSYFPLKEGTEVYINFLSSDINSGYISGIGPSNSSHPIGLNNKNYLIAETGRSRVYIDDERNRFHISLNNGKTDFLMDDKGIILQLSETKGTEPAITTLFEINENGLIFKIGDKSLIFNDTGFSVNMGPDNQTSFTITDKGITSIGEKFINNTSYGNINNYSTNNSYFQSDGDLNIRSNVTKITGHQRLSLNSAVVHLNGWLDTHIKAGMNLNIESKLKLSFLSTLRDEKVLGMSNFFSTMDNRTTVMESTTSNTKADAVVTAVEDGMRIKGLGVGTSIATSLATAANSTMLGTMAGFAGLTTLFSIDNIGTSLASATINDNTVGDAAADAISINNNSMGTIIQSSITDNNFINKLNKRYQTNLIEEIKYTDYSSIKDL